MQVYKGAARRASPKAPSRRRRYVYRPPGAGHWAMTLQLSTVAPLDAIARACNSVAGQAQTARTWGLFERTAARRKKELRRVGTRRSHSDRA